MSDPNFPEACRLLLLDEIKPALVELGLEDNAGLGVLIGHVVARTIELCGEVSRQAFAEVGIRPNRATRRKKPPRGQRKR
jgi:hypothetical protein